MERSNVRQACVLIAVVAGLPVMARAQTPAPPPANPNANIVVDNPTYLTIPLEIEVNKSAAEVWKRVGKYCDIGEWLQIPTGCTILKGKDGEVGAVRSVANEVLVGKTEFSYTYTQTVRAGRPGRLVELAMQDQQWQCERREGLLQALVSANHFRDRLSRLRLVRDQRVGIHRSDDRGVAGEIFILQPQDVRMRRHVRQALEHGERKIRSRHLKGEAFADEAGEFALMFKSVEARDDAAGAVTEHENREAGVIGAGDPDSAVDVGDVVSECLDVEPLAI